MKYFMAGIKGVGMSSLACILKDLGNEVVGYDDYLGETLTLENLKLRNIKIVSDIDYLTDQYVLIYTSAINNEHKLIKKALSLNIKMYEYFEFVGEFSKKYDTISIAGTHGKTTTTAMLSLILNKKFGCNYIIGDGMGHVDKNSDILVLESCEYRRHFLKYYPKYTVITNIDLDHVDCYNDIEDIISAFQKFVDQTSDKVIACGDCPNVKKIKSKNIIYYGLNEDNDIKATNIEYTKDGSSFDCIINNSLFGRFNLHIYGKHMIQNALAVIYICYLYGISSDDINLCLNEFTGAKRRFMEEEYKDVILVDDYAHHPKEVKTVIEHARQKYSDRTIIGVLIPYTYSRVKEFYRDFAEVLNLCDYSFVTDVEGARENASDYKGVTKDLIINLTDRCDDISSETIDKLYKYSNAVILFMGCKDPKWLMDAYKKGK